MTGHTVTTISVFEHNKIPLTGDDPPLQERHLRQLERLNRQAGAELVKLGYRQIQATSYVGVIQLGAATLQVLPKVDYRFAESDSDTDRVQSAVANLLWMLVYAGELPIHEQDITGLLKQRGSLFEILVRIFADRLLEQLQRGLHRHYRQQTETLPVLKGRWQLSRQLQTQPLIKDKFLVSYDEFIPDNLLNRVLYFTTHLLRQYTRSAANRKQLDIIRLWFEDVTLLPRIQPQTLARVTFTRLNVAWQPIFNLACMFLLQESLQLSSGSTQAFTFLFDMNLLFERFVTGFLRRHRQQALPEHLQECEILAQGRGDARWLARLGHKNGRRVFRLKPDLMLRRPDKRVALIIDTKYKTHPRINEADVYQMHAYATRFECPDVLLLYPEAQMRAQVLYLDQAGETKLRTNTINLQRNLNQPAGRDDLARELAQVLQGE